MGADSSLKNGNINNRGKLMTVSQIFSSQDPVLSAVRDSALATAHLIEEQIIEEGRFAVVDREGVEVADYDPLDLQHPAFIDLRERFRRQDDADAPVTRAEIRELARKIEGISTPPDVLFGEIFRRFGVTSYGTMTRSQYDQVTTFLQELASAS